MKKRFSNTKLIFTTIIILLICMVSVNIGMDSITGQFTWRPSFKWFSRNTPVNKIAPTDRTTTISPTKPIIVAPTKSTTACKDFDGENEFKKGYVNYNNNKYEDYCVKKVGTRTGSSFLSRFRISYSYSKVSSCTGSDCYVNEYICSDDKVSYKRILCENGCEDGACLTETKKSCTDTDDGKDYSKQGTITITYENGNKRTEKDYCNSDGTLREWFCGDIGDPAGLLRSENYVKCSFDTVCKDGACVKEEQEKECYFSEEIQQPSNCPEGNCKILMVVESEIYNLIKNSLTTFSLDLKNELGYNVEIELLTRKSDETGVKTIIMDKYNSGKLEGIFLIGNIPTVRVKSGSIVALSDQEYYQDIFNKCVYSNSDDTYNCEIIPRPFLPPFWVSRIMAPIEIRMGEYPDEWTNEQRLEYLIAFKKENYFLGWNKNDESIPFFEMFNLIYKPILATSDFDRAKLINQYFKYNHLFRTNQILTIKEPILYTPIENDDLDQAEVSKQLIKESLLKAGYKQDGIHFLNSAPGENKEFLEAIKKPYEFAFINAHGNPEMHHYNINKNTLQESNIIILQPTSCSIGNFRNPNFIAGHYLMDGKTQFLTAGSINIFGAMHIDEGYIISLTSGKRIFEAWEFNPTQLNWFGDPTIKMRYDGQLQKKDGPKICISHNKLDFGDITKNPEKINFKIYNKGSGTLDISKIHDLHPVWLFFNEKIPRWESGSMFLKGGKSKNFNLEDDGSYLELNIEIDIPDVAVPGIYKGYIYLVSNDINNPVLKIPLSFKI